MRDDIELSELTEEEAPIAAPLSSLRLGIGIHDGVPITDYIADPCEEPSLRSSDLQRLLRMTPSHVKAHHPRLSEKPTWAIKKATPQMKSGTIIHELVLGFGAGFTVIDPADFKTKEGKPAQTLGAAECKAAIKEAEDAGLVWLNPKQNEAAQRTAERLKAKLAEELDGWPDGFAMEQTVIWEEQTEHGTVLCRTRPDLFSLEREFSGELKTTGLELSDDGLQKILSADDGKMFVQAAWQMRGLIATFPDLAGRLTHSHYFGEIQYPNEVAPVPASKVALMLADRRCRRAVERFALLRSKGEWWAWAPRIGEMAPYLDARWQAEEEEDAAREDAD